MMVVTSEAAISGSEPRAGEWKRPPRGWLEAGIQIAIAFVVSYDETGSRTELLTAPENR